MDRHEAIRLLRGGLDGIREWNQWRRQCEEIPGLSGVDLSGAILSEVDLSEVVLRGADFHGADLRGADLRGARLSEADLSEADLRGADLRGARLSEAKGLTQAQIESARGDVHTELPEGMVRPANWVDPPLPPLLPPQADNP
jgi:hypothetical protein